MILADRIKVTLVAGGVTADVMNDVVEWDSFEILQERDDVSGVVTSVSFPLKLRNKGMKLLKSVFDRDGLYASGTLKVYQRGDHDNDYTLVKSSPLDFSTYEEHSDYVSIECSESELMDIINSEGKTKYDILVEEVKAEKRWNYKRMEVRNIGIYTLPEDTPSTITRGGMTLVQLYVYFDHASQAPGTSEVDFKTQPYGLDYSQYFVKSLERELMMNYDVDFAVQVDIEIDTASDGGDATDLLSQDFKLGIYKIKNYELLNGASVTMTGGEITGDGTTYKRTFTASWKQFLTQRLEKDTQACLVVLIPDSGGRGWFVTAKTTFTSFNKFEAYYYEASENEVDIDVIDPSKLLNKYLEMMAGEERFTGAIDWEEEDYKTMIVAAESARGFGEVKGAPGGAYLHGSPNDFIEWLRVLGYEPVIDGNAITFKARDKVFLPDVTAMELEEGEVADLIKQADSTFAYTSVDIGYEKQDYENENGIYEANGTYAYTTGYVTREDNKLSLISPYRADSMGIEFLCQKRDNYTTDDKSDNDIFFVALKEQDGDYVEYMDMSIDTDSGRIRMFNAPFNPYFLVLRNESLIGINTRQLKFKSTDMSREAKIPGYDIYGDVEISKRLFLPVVYNFAAGHTKDMPTDNRDGLVKVAWHGETLCGYIKSVRKNYLTEEETTWELHAYEKA